MIYDIMNFVEFLFVLCVVCASSRTSRTGDLQTRILHIHLITTAISNVLYRDPRTIWIRMKYRITTSLLQVASGLWCNLQSRLTVNESNVSHVLVYYFLSSLLLILLSVIISCQHDATRATITRDESR